MDVLLANYVAPPAIWPYNLGTVAIWAGCVLVGWLVVKFPWRTARRLLALGVLVVVLVCALGSTAVISRLYDDAVQEHVEKARDTITQDAVVPLGGAE